jgi:hypothetical protein
VVAGNTVVVINDRGRIDAFRVTPRATALAQGRKSAPPPAPTPAPDR